MKEILEVWNSVPMPTRQRVGLGALYGLGTGGAISAADWVMNRTDRPWSHTAKNLALGALAGGGSGLGYDKWYRRQYPGVALLEDTMWRESQARDQLKRAVEGMMRTLRKGSQDVGH